MTNREKYEAIVAEYGSEDAMHPPYRKSLRILLDLPATDPPALKVGDMVRCGRSGITNPQTFKVQTILPEGWVKILDADGSSYTWNADDLTSIPAWNR